jgi:hypothetical protein
MDVIIKKEQPHDVRIEMWRYYHEGKPFQQPKVRSIIFFPHAISHSIKLNSLPPVSIGFK